MVKSSSINPHARHLGGSENCFTFLEYRPPNPIQHDLQISHWQ